jgi:predicted ArsR family transcriptional regulator
LQVAQEEEADIVIKKEENEDAKEEKNDPKDRKQKIIELLKDKGGQNIKDIKEEVRHVTDKTILRDITELMLEKKVFRVGEKRWAKYYLK